MRENNIKKKIYRSLVGIQESNSTSEYLGSDGLPIDESYNKYLQKCSEFIAKGKKYQEDNKVIKNSHLHQVKYGYDTSLSQEEILNQRKKQYEYYIKSFDVTHFSEDQNAVFENISGQSKKIRIIRNLNEKRVTENDNYIENFSQETNKWFTRYCTLSKFVQSGRMIIILNRLKKNLEILKKLTPEDILKFEID